MVAPGGGAKYDEINAHIYNAINHDDDDDDNDDVAAERDDDDADDDAGGGDDYLSIDVRGKLA